MIYFSYNRLKGDDKMHIYLWTDYEEENNSEIAKQNPSLMNYIEDMDDSYYLEIPFGEIKKDLEMHFSSKYKGLLMTYIGMFTMKKDKDSISIKNDDITYSVMESNIKLCLETESNIIEFEEKVDFLCSDYYGDIMLLLRFHDSQMKFIITKHGKMFWFKNNMDINKKPIVYNSDFFENKKISIRKIMSIYSYVVRFYDEYMAIPYMDSQKRKALEETQDIILSQVANKDIIKYFDNVKNEYSIFLTLNNTKNGKIARYLIDKYHMEYNMVPNFFMDDKTLNIILYEPDEKEIHQYYEYIVQTHRKYSSYSIYNIDIDLLCKAMQKSNNYLAKKKINSYSFRTLNDVEYAQCLGIIKNILLTFPLNEEELFAFVSRINEIAYKIPKYKYEKQLPETPLYPNTPRLREIEDFYWRTYFKNIKYIISDKIQNSDELTPEEIEYNNVMQPYQEKKKEVNNMLASMESTFLSEMIDRGLYNNKWKNEQELFKVVRSLYSDAIYQYHSKFLELQSLDIFIPSINLGIEYQGEQHYIPIDFFGGEDGLRKRKELDEKKLEKCKAHGVMLLYWKYNELITKKTVKEKIDDFINNIE
ncbi:hypothetical protein [Massilimicrobiota sp. An134]|uniref:hypothetical protein n=1 Tax=Massilimicrobiota sp. An134 TaxID=1965557 RepID=UPI00117EFA02|nr:hypothetical protein [Massilimicrobiota sp. An134]